MYRELTSRVLVGGFVSREVNANFLVRSGVTHIVNASDTPLPVMVSKQFWSLELKGANRDDEHKPGYWPVVFTFTRQTLKKKTNILYFHVTPEILSRPASPVAVYAALRAMGYSPLESRSRLLEAHPFFVWHERAIGFVEVAFSCWCRQHGVKLRCDRKPLLKAKAAETAEVGVDDLLDGAIEWTH